MALSVIQQDHFTVKPEWMNEANNSPHTKRMNISPRHDTDNVGMSNVNVSV